MTADTTDKPERVERRGIQGPIKESRRLRIVISHKKRTRRRLQETLERVDAELVDLDKKLDLVVRAEKAASA